MTTYVYDSIEVKLTGRTASKDVEKVERRSGKKSIEKEVRYEITPSSNEDGSWKKWVLMSDLFTVESEK